MFEPAKHFGARALATLAGGIAIAILGCNSASPSSSPARANPVASPGAAAPSATSTIDLPGVQTFPDQGQDHLAAGQTGFLYNSNPPTSGPHAPNWAPWAVLDQQVPREVLVHNMEHGGVVVWYNCRGSRQLSQAECSELQSQLAAIQRDATANKKQVVVAPYSEMPNLLALTSWGKLLTLEAFDATTVSGFIERYDRAFNPEGF